MNPNLPHPSRRERLFRLLFALFLLLPPALFADGPVRVACVGDSITYGFGLKDRDHNSYPACLGRLLGPGYDVRNFGHSGATLLRKGDLPYDRQPEHTAAVAFKPDVVVIMLGTNDSKHRTNPTNNVPDNWPHKGDYVRDYESLIGEFHGANPAVKVFVCYPTPCFPGRWGIDDDTIHYEVIPLVHQVADHSKATVIDLYDAFAGKKDLFPDTVHPNAAGAKLMADDVYTALAGKNP